MSKFNYLKNAKQLGLLLSEAQIASLNISPESDEAKKCREVKHLCFEDESAPPIGKFLASIDEDGTGIAGIVQYWNFRDEVEKYQVENNISSVSWQTVEWKGEVFRYPYHDTQLAAMPQDSKVVNRHFWKTIAFYRSFVERWHLPLFKDEGDYDNDSTLQEFDALAKEIFNPNAYCVLSGDDEHSPVYDGDTPYPYSIAYYKTDYNLSMYSGFGDRCNCHFFSASTRLNVSHQ